jgi:hypothetical protein
LRLSASLISLLLGGCTGLLGLLTQFFLTALPFERILPFLGIQHLVYRTQGFGCKSWDIH